MDGGIPNKKPKKKAKGGARGQLADLGEEEGDEGIEGAEGGEEADGDAQALEEEDGELGQMFILEEEVNEESAQDPWLNCDPWKMGRNKKTFGHNAQYYLILSPPTSSHPHHQCQHRIPSPQDWKTTIAGTLQILERHNG